MSHHKKEPHNIRPFKLLAQSFGMFVCGFLVLFLLSEGFSDTRKEINYNVFTLLTFILLPLAGYILTWFNEKSGAGIMVIGGILLFGYFMKELDIKMALIFGIPLIIAGSLFFLHIIKRTALQHTKL